MTVSQRILHSKWRILQSPMPNEHPGSDASSAWNFCACSSDVTSRKPVVVSHNVGCFLRLYCPVFPKNFAKVRFIPDPLWTSAWLHLSYSLYYLLCPYEGMTWSHHYCTRALHPINRKHRHMKHAECLDQETWVPSLWNMHPDTTRDWRRSNWHMQFARITS